MLLLLLWREVEVYRLQVSQQGQVGTPRHAGHGGSQPNKNILCNQRENEDNTSFVRKLNKKSEPDIERRKKKKKRPKKDLLRNTGLCSMPEVVYSMLSNLLEMKE